MSNVVIEPCGSGYRASLLDARETIRFWIAECPNTLVDRFAVIFEGMTKTGQYDSFFTICMNRIGYTFYDESDFAWLQELTYNQGRSAKPENGYYIISYDDLPAACQNVIHQQIKQLILGSEKYGYVDKKFRIHFSHTSAPTDIFAKTYDDAVKTLKMTRPEAEISSVEQINILDIE